MEGREGNRLVRYLGDVMQDIYESKVKGGQEGKEAWAAD